MRAPLSLLCLALLLTACGQGEPLTPANATLPDGGRYRGEIVNGLLQGPGRIDYSNGSWYAGAFQDGQAQGVGEWQGAHGEHYAGEFRVGEFDGQGRLSRSDGSLYQGHFKLGQMDGEGHYQHGKLSYRGEFKADQYHGLGNLELADGASYQGQFKQGEPDGQGVRKDADGNLLSGTFKHGLLDGEGSYNGADGEQYVGGFKRDSFAGKGRYTSSTGDVWLGQFKRGALTGAGEFIGDDGRHYRGQMRNWRFHGQGQLQLADGSHYSGAFADDQYHGIGQLTQVDGSISAGQWQHGQRVRDEQQKNLSDPLELGLLKQGALLEQALAAIPQSTPAIELYSLTLAGDGSQGVFLREADYANTLLRERFAAYGQISLINHREHMTDRPLATRENLRRAIQTISERSGKEDLVFIYLTSHGSHDHQLSLNQPRLQLGDLSKDELAELLRPLKERNKVVVIAACYAGGFIPPLQDQHTLVMTASRADRVSFGCSDEADFTYFGRALLNDALNETDDLQRAFKLAKSKVAEREKAGDFQASEPQMWAPKGVLAQWQKLRQTQAVQALSASTSANTSKTVD
ncbi:MAG: peptidase C13 [Pseudomonadaceae bacterium]|nr:peptidase C13 [Pseudomonadaceae bacterium]